MILNLSDLSDEAWGEIVDRMESLVPLSGGEGLESGQLREDVRVVFSRDLDSGTADGTAATWWTRAHVLEILQSRKEVLELAERFVEVAWQHGEGRAYKVDIQVRAYDRQGLLRDITEVLSNDYLNVTAVNTLTDRKTHIADMTLTLDVEDVEQLSRALVKIEQLPNVMEVRRKHA